MVGEGRISYDREFSSRINLTEENVNGFFNMITMFASYRDFSSDRQAQFSRIEYKANPLVPQMSYLNTPLTSPLPPLAIGHQFLQPHFSSGKCLYYRPDNNCVDCSNIFDKQRRCCRVTH